MDISIFKLPTIKSSIEIIKKDIKYDNNISPRLIKFGFNNIINYLDTLKLTATDNYKIGLNFDFDSQITQDCLTKSKIFNEKNFTIVFTEFWEIFTLFGLIKNNTTICTSHKNDLQNVLDEYMKISVNDRSVTKASKISIVEKNANIYISRYSDNYLDENSLVYVVLNTLNKINKMDNSSTLILQFFDINTNVTAQLIYYLASLFNSSYIIKPASTSNISNSKYLVFLDLKKTQIFNFDTTKNYIYSLFKNTLDSEFENTLKCVNFDLMPKIIKTYSVICKYLETKVYVGAGYDELAKIQNSYIQLWFDTFSNKNKIQQSFDDSVNNFYHKCSFITNT